MGVGRSSISKMFKRQGENIYMGIRRRKEVIKGRSQNGKDPESHTKEETVVEVLVWFWGLWAHLQPARIVVQKLCHLWRKAPSPPSAAVRSRFGVLQQPKNRAGPVGC